MSVTRWETDRGHRRHHRTFLRPSHASASRRRDPSTLADVYLHGIDRAGGAHKGQATLAVAPHALARVRLDPAAPQAYEPALEAIREADVIVIGPGSLYTSLIPNFLVAGVADAVRASHANRIYVCNVANMRGETHGLDAADHVAALIEHGAHDTVDLSSCTTRDSAARPCARMAPSSRWRRARRFASASRSSALKSWRRISPTRTTPFGIRIRRCAACLREWSPSMSFTAEVKDELSRIEPKRQCCLRAELAALVRIEGTLHISGPKRYRLEVATETAPVARAVIKLLHGVYGLKTELTVRRSVLHKTNNYLITVRPSPSCPPPRGARHRWRARFSIGIDPKLVKRDCCAISYLRGAFLGGFVADPHGDSLRATAETEQLADGHLSRLRSASRYPRGWPGAVAPPFT
jgi:hypothetical protein